MLPLEERTDELLQISYAVPVQDPIEALDSHAVIVKRKSALDCLVEGNDTLKVLEKDFFVQLRKGLLDLQ